MRPYKHRHKYCRKGKMQGAFSLPGGCTLKSFHDRMLTKNLRGKIRSALVQLVLQCMIIKLTLVLILFIY